MEIEQKPLRTEEVQEFVASMFNYVFPRRFDEQKIPRKFDGTDDRQPSEVHFKSDIGEAVLLLCHINGNSFLNRFISDYPEYLSNTSRFVKYCARLALQLYNEENIMNSLLMVSSMIIEMVSYCLKPNVENGMLFVNSADECWLSIFKGQFEKAFFVSGGWKSLQEASEEKARIYEKIKREYPSFSDKNVQFRYWIGDEDPETPEIFALEAGYWRIIKRVHQIIHSNMEHKDLFQQILDSDESDLEADVMQQRIYDPDSEHSSTHETAESFSNLHLHENVDLKCPISKSSVSATAHVPPGINVDDSIIETEMSSETEPKDLVAISKTFQETGQTCETSANLSLDTSFKNVFIKKFMDISSFANSIDGLYIDNFLSRSENIDLLMSNNDYLMLMKDAIDNPGKKPDVKQFVDAARIIIKEASSPGMVKRLDFENKQTDIQCSGNLEQTVEMQNLLTPETDKLPPAGKILNLANVENQPVEYTNIQCQPKIEISYEKKCIQNAEVQSSAESNLKLYVEAACRTLKTKQCAEYLITESKKIQLCAIKPRYIKQVLQRLNCKLGNVLPVTDALELEDLDFPYTGQGTVILMELFNFSHTLTDRIQTFLKEFPSSYLTRYFDKDLEKLVSERVGIRIAMSTLRRSTNLDEIDLSRFYMELLKALIGECAFFLRFENKLRKVEIKAARYSTSTRPKRNRVRKYRTKSISQSAPAEALPESSTDVENRKRRKHLSKNLFYCQTSKYIDSTTSDSSNSSVCIPKRPRLPSHDTESPEPMTDNSSVAESVKQSSDSEEN